MSKRSPSGLAYWRSLFEEGPEVAATNFADRLTAQNIPAAIAYRPTSEELRQIFRAAEGTSGPFRGVPIAVKDCYDVASQLTRAGSAFYHQVRPATAADASLVAQVRELGGIPALKTQMEEFACGMTGRNAHFGPCPHPTLAGATPGGSSSGSAWAVASGLTPMALGSDTGGSLRVPAAWCGLYAMRVPQRDWSTHGFVPLVPSFDTAGWLTATAEDMLTVSEALLQRGGTRMGKRLKVLSLLQHSGHLDLRLRARYEAIDELLNVVSEPEGSAYLAFNLVGSELAYNILGTREMAQVHAEWLDPYRAHYGADVWARIDSGRRRTVQELEMASKKRLAVTQAFKDVFLNYDAVVMPVVPVPTPQYDQMNDALRSRLLQLNAPASLARLPVLTIPVSLNDGRTGGVQVIFPGVVRMRFSEILSLFTGQN